MNFVYRGRLFEQQCCLKMSLFLLRIPFKALKLERMNLVWGGASPALCRLVAAECLRGWTGGDAVISAAMPLQPSPVWHPALSHPWSPQSHLLTTDLPASLPPSFPPLLSLLWPPWSTRGKELFKWKEKKRRKKYIYMYYYISLWKKKDYREDKGGSVIAKMQRLCIIWFFSVVECTGNVLIVYILNLNIWKI